MKIALAQINTIVGDIAANARAVKTSIAQAEAASCRLIVFPELTLTGYPPRDLLENRRFIADNQKALAEVAAGCTRLTALVGFADTNQTAVGKPLHNAAALLQGGMVASVYHKWLLPSYDVFDEGRHFEPGGKGLVFTIDGRRFGAAICEDIWIDQAAAERRVYRTNPLDQYGNASLDYLVTMSASPFSMEKSAVRRRLVTTLSGQSDWGVIYVNLVGGNDELVFDGQSFVADRQGKVVARARAFTEDMIVFDTQSGSGDLRPELTGDMACLEAALTLGLRDYVAKCGFSKVVLGLSGGIDSAVTAALAARALGAEQVIGVLMPSPFTSPESEADAAKLAENLNLATVSIPISRAYHAYLEALEPSFSGMAPDAAEENVQARIRGNLLMALSNKFGWLVINTGNKSELAMGYCTLYGDMSGGLSVLGDVPKTMVYALAAWLNKDKPVIPERIFTKPPTAELRFNQKDEDSLPPYGVLDPILKLYIEDNLDLEAIIASGYPADLVAEIVNRVDKNEYKRRQAPPVLRMTTKSFGMGRRLPIAQNYRHNLTGS